MDYILSQKLAPKYCCSNCDYYTQRKNDYDKHLSTAKHLKKMKKITNDDINRNNVVIIIDESAHKYKCSCGNAYKYRQGLFKHKSICGTATKKEINATFVMDIIKENQEFKTLLIEQQNQVIELQKENNILMNKMVEISHTTITTPSVINNNNSTTNNNQFNLNIFLNETCKNAINFSDFIDNIHVTDDDLENNAKMGFVEGVTKIIMDNLRLLELTNRPIHCTDVKRETIYVKVEEQWDKDNSIKVIQKGIQDITCKNMQQLVDWRENNPSYADDMDSELGEKSIVMQQNSMAGSKREEYYPKIIKNIAKESIISNKSSLVKISL